MNIAPRFPCARCGKARSVTFAWELCSDFCIAPKDVEKIRGEFERARRELRVCWPYRSRIQIYGVEFQTPRVALWLWSRRKLDMLPNARWCPRWPPANREVTCVNPRHIRVPNAKRKIHPRERIAWTEEQKERIRAVVASGVSQREVARRLGVYNNQISRIVREGKDEDARASHVPVD